MASEEAPRSVVHHQSVNPHHESVDVPQPPSHILGLTRAGGSPVRISQDELERHVLVALLRMGGMSAAKDIAPAIRRELSVPASTGRVYACLGTLVERELITVGPQLCFDGHRNKTQTVIRLTRAGESASAAMDTDDLKCFGVNDS